MESSASVCTGLPRGMLVPAAASGDPRFPGDTKLSQPSARSSHENSSAGRVSVPGRVRYVLFRSVLLSRRKVTVLVSTS